MRYGYNQNTQPYGASSNSTPDNWGTSNNKFDSINLNHNLLLGGSKLNEFIFQFADFANTISANSNNPYQTFPNTVTTGQSINTPQTTQQRKFQFRDDFSWHTARMGGLGHDFKVGVNFINEPHLFITFQTAKGVIQYTHLDNSINGPIQTVQISDGDSSANIPTKQYATYFQDDWRVNDRLTVNAGVRYDYVQGVVFDQSKNPNFVALQAAGAAGRFANVIGMQDFGKTPQDDRTNVPHIFAIGDVVGQPMLAHKAMHEAKVAAEVIAGKNSFFDARAIPSVAYTDPEVAWAGVTESEAKAAGVAYGKGVFPWAASGRSLTLGRSEGMTKVLFDEATGRVIGCGIVGTSAGDLISEAVLAIEMGADAADIGLTIHPHPTLSETVAMAAEAFEGTITDLYLPRRPR